MIEYRKLEKFFVWDNFPHYIYIHKFCVEMSLHIVKTNLEVAIFGGRANLLAKYQPHP